jgi:uncharacterized membrane protein
MDNELQLFVASYSDQSAAKACLAQLQQMEKDGVLDVVDAATIVKQNDGKLKIDELRELTPKKGRRRGAVVGGIFGAIFPPSLLISAVVGGAAGGLIGRLTDQGFENDDLKAIGEDLAPGESAIVAVVEDKWVAQIAAGLVGYDRLVQHMLDADVAAAVTADAAGNVAGVVVATVDEPESSETASPAPESPETASSAPETTDPKTTA